MAHKSLSEFQSRIHPDDSTEPQTDAEDTANLFIENKASDSNISPRTVENYTRSLGVFLHFLDSRGTTQLADVDSRDIIRYGNEMKNNTALTTADKRLQHLQTFTKWAETYEYIPEGLKEKVEKQRPDLDPEDWAKETHIKTDRAQEILSDFEDGLDSYATREHVEFLLIWSIGLRVSALLAIDCGDIQPQKQQINIVNRPPETRLKQGNKGERIVNITPEVAEVVQDYIKHRRKEPKDKWHNGDREPLLTSVYGRIDDSTVYRDIAAATSCGKCDLSRRDRSKCDMSIGTHDLRRSSITEQCNQEFPIELLSERVNAKPSTLERHYNQQTKQERADIRKQYVTGD